MLRVVTRTEPAGFNLCLYTKLLLKVIKTMYKIERIYYFVLTWFDAPEYLLREKLGKKLQVYGAYNFLS